MTTDPLELSLRSLADPTELIAGPADESTTLRWSEPTNALSTPPGLVDWPTQAERQTTPLKYPGIYTEVPPLPSPVPPTPATQPTAPGLNPLAGPGATACRRGERTPGEVKTPAPTPGEIPGSASGRPCG